MLLRRFGGQCGTHLSVCHSQEEYHARFEGSRSQLCLVLGPERPAGPWYRPQRSLQPIVTRHERDVTRTAELELETMTLAKSARRLVGISCQSVVGRPCNLLALPVPGLSPPEYSFSYDYLQFNNLCLIPRSSQPYSRSRSECRASGECSTGLASPSLQRAPSVPSPRTRPPPARSPMATHILR